MRLRTPLHPLHDTSADHGHTRFDALDASSVESEAPAYVWPLNPWGGYPFRRAQA